MCLFVCLFCFFFGFHHIHTQAHDSTCTIYLYFHLNYVCISTHLDPPSQLVTFAWQPKLLGQDKCCFQSHRRMQKESKTYWSVHWGTMSWWAFAVGLGDLFNLCIHHSPINTWLLTVQGSQYIFIKHHQHWSCAHIRSAKLPCPPRRLVQACYCDLKLWILMHVQGG